MAVTRIDVEHNEGDIVQTNIQRKAKWLFAFTPIGRKSMKNTQSLDALDIICKFDKSELFVLSIVKTLITSNHLVTIRREDYSEGDQRKLQKGIKSFIDKSLLVRIKRECYMVNPYFLTPPIALQESVKIAWEAL